MKVFIDANIINFAAIYQKSDVLSWINELYDQVYIHTSVLKELLIIPIKEKVLGMIEKGDWILFNPDDPECISEEQFTIYESFARLVKDGFIRLDIKKRQEGRVVKNTNNIGRSIFKTYFAWLRSERMYTSPSVEPVLLLIAISMLLIKPDIYNLQGGE